MLRAKAASSTVALLLASIPVSPSGDRLSAQKRGLTLPDDAAAGRRMGELIKQKARADHDQLLYVVVDETVRTVGTKDQALASK